MFFPNKIKSIRDSDYVLEIGPGGSPHPRADVLLEKTFIDSEEAYQQRGYAEAPESKKIVYYCGGKFPFADNEFDYVICSHVLEHIPISELELFVSELTRVAKRGYIEFPNALYEVMNYQAVHKNLMSYENDKILILGKTAFINSPLLDAWRVLFYHSDLEMYKVYNMYPQLFFHGFEWVECFEWGIVQSMEELYSYNVASEVALVIKQKNKKLKRKPSGFTTVNLILFKKLARKILQKLRSLKKKQIAKSAIVENRNLVLLHSTTEIKENVIIRTFKNRVTIGRYSQINPGVVIYGGSGVSIGDYVMIAPSCVIAAGNHRIDDITKPMRFAGSVSNGAITIEDDVWIGANCTITDAVTIGKGAVIGANSVVTKDISPYAIAVGVPAREVGTRKKILNSTE